MHLLRPEYAVSGEMGGIRLADGMTTYLHFMLGMQAKFSALLPEEPLLRVSTDGLYDAYRQAVAARPCRDCRKFFDAYGGAVHVDAATGRTVSALWRAAPGVYGKAVEALRTLCEERPVIGALSTYATHLCERKFANGIGHLHLYGPHRPLPDTVLAAAFDVVSKSVETHSLLTVTKAQSVLRKLGGDRIVPMAQKLDWLARYLRKAANVRDADRRTNLLWRAMAQEPEQLFNEGNVALSAMLYDLRDGIRTRTALADLSHALDRRPRVWP